jgi:hypothetical protein
MDQVELSNQITYAYHNSDNEGSHSTSLGLFEIEKQHFYMHSEQTCT